MSTFTNLELAVLQAIFFETPELAPTLQQQLEAAFVTDRENSGHGFFTMIAVAIEAPIVNFPLVLGRTTHARVAGLEHGFGFVLFLEDGKLNMLEGFGYGPESTYGLDLTALQFEVYNQLVNRVG